MRAAHNTGLGSARHNIIITGKEEPSVGQWTISLAPPS